MRSMSLPGQALIGFTLAVILCQPGAADEPARLHSAGDRLMWEPASALGAHQLTVGGARVFRRQVFPAGATPEIELFDAAGDPLPDGIYTWSLELLPPPIQAAWDPVNGRDQRPGSPPAPRTTPTSVSQTGYFLVQGGRLIEINDPAPASGTSQLDSDSSIERGQ